MFIFNSGGEQMARDLTAPFLGEIPIEPALAKACDEGKPFISLNSQRPAAGAMDAAFKPLLGLGGEMCGTQNIKDYCKEGNKMKVAIPVTEGKLSLHFGHCEQFAIFDVDSDSKSIQSEDLVTSPGHEPGLLPKWLSEMNVGLIIAGGMGQRAQQLFAQNNIDVIFGATENEPKQVVLRYLAGQLQCGQNICDH